MKVFGKKANTPTATVTEKFATVEETAEFEEESATNYNDITSAETGIEANTARSIEVLVKLGNVNKIIQFTPSPEVPDLDAVFMKLVELAKDDTQVERVLSSTGHVVFKKLSKKFNIYIDLHHSNILSDGDILKVVTSNKRSKISHSDSDSEIEDEDFLNSEKLQKQQSQPSNSEDTS